MPVLYLPPRSRAPRCTHPGCDAPGTWRPRIEFVYPPPAGELYQLRLPRLVCSEHALPIFDRHLPPGEWDAVRAAFTRNGLAPPDAGYCAVRFERARAPA